MDVFYQTYFGKFEWDSEKDAINIRKHGISFLDAPFVFQDENRLEFYDDGCEDEDRFRVIAESSVFWC